MTKKPEWRYLIGTRDPDHLNPPTRMLDITGGWLYQVAVVELGSYGARVVGWHTPVFVPE